MRFSIKLKLLVLAGIPVLGALILAALIASDARRQAESAAALGSIEDLAHLSAQISNLVQELQFERNAVALEMAERSAAGAELGKRFAATDRAERQLAAFLAARSVTQLPPRLARDLRRARAQLAGLPALRTSAREGARELTDVLEYYEETNRSLIRATAALAQLTDDGELMRAISALVGVLEIKERKSQEHALLTHVFTAKTFPPGTYKKLVTLLTEEADYIDALELHATDAVAKRFRAEQLGPEHARATELRNVALNTLDEDFQVDAEEWSRVQTSRIMSMRKLEIELNEAVRSVAIAKVAAAKRSVQLSYGLGAGIVVVSALLAGFIARGVSRSVGALASTAQRVRLEKDFSVRAERMSDDELGALTFAFNEMLSGIQERDEELARHRNDLERLVEERTLELQRRNRAMRLVLDNVDQALASVERDGTLSSERSRAFDAWFGAPTPGEPFEERIAGGDERLQAKLRLAWDQVVEGFLPISVALDQMPRRATIRGRHYALEYKAICGGSYDPDDPRFDHRDFQGVLLVITDITEEVKRLRNDAEQREQIAIFEHLRDDRQAFQQFVKECDALVADLSSGAITDVRQATRAAHTLKGNCASFDVTSVTEIAHRLETHMVELDALPSSDQIAELVRGWRAFTERVRNLSHASGEPVAEVTHEELDQLLSLVTRGASHAEIGARLTRWKHERVAVRLRRAAEQARGLAKKLGKGEIVVDVRAPKDVRLPEEPWAPFWATFVHLLRNAVDHGLETPEERTQAGKPAEGHITLTAALDAREFVIEVSDDGRGIDWSRIRQKASQRGLPHATEHDLVEALFTDGVTTKDQVTNVSGRGVGLSAIREAARALSGTVAVTSRAGAGATFSFRFPSLAAGGSGLKLSTRSISQH